MGDGDGWANCDAGHRHWGRHGAAGLLLHHGDDVLLQKRARLSIGGGTWGLLGGARHSHERPVEAALREASEESTLNPSLVRPHWLSAEHHGGWSYETVIGSVPERPDVRPKSFETAAVAWVPAAKVALMKLFPPFAEAWPHLRRSLYRQVIVVDTANVMGSRADGWWRDRRGAAERLRDEIARVDGFPNVPAATAELCYPEIIMVVEGAARNIESVRGVKVVSAPGSGDDTIAELATPAAPTGPVSPATPPAAMGPAAPPTPPAPAGLSAPATSPAPAATAERRLVITADRELRARCEAAGATVTGPRWLLEILRTPSLST